MSEETHITEPEDYSPSGLLALHHLNNEQITELQSMLGNDPDDGIFDKDLAKKVLEYYELNPMDAKDIGQFAKDRLTEFGLLEELKKIGGEYNDIINKAPNASLLQLNKEFSLVCEPYADIRKAPECSAHFTIAANTPEFIRAPEATNSHSFTPSA